MIRSALSNLKSRRARAARLRHALEDGVLFIHGRVVDAALGDGRADGVEFLVQI